MQTREQKLTGGKALVEAARANGMTTIFGVPGAQIYPLFDALHGTDIELIVPRHEQAAAYMAMGYAKSTGRTGVFTVVPGPGVLNAAAADVTITSPAWANGATATNFVWDLVGASGDPTITGFGAPSATASTTQNGSPTGSIAR